ncbi:SRPBCC family protein [Spirosoma pulveris]
MANKKQPVSRVLGMEPIEPDASGSSRINVGNTERVWSMAGGALLATYGLRRGSFGGLLLASLGGFMIYRGASGYCPMNQALGRNTAEPTTPNQVVDSIEITKSLTINKPRQEVYAYWRQLENLPRFMFHLSEVRQLDNNRSHWVAKLSDGLLAKTLGTVEWDAEILEEVENERLVWKSVADARIDNAGEVRFVDAPNGQGTEVHAFIAYRPPAGQVGGVLMKLFNPAFAQLIKQDLRRFKQLLETGEIATIEGQPSGRKPEQQTSKKPVSEHAEADEKHESAML